MKPGDRVEKVRGYKWPGVIVASFSTIGGQRRLVVECTVPEVAGALHIYAPDQLRVVEEVPVSLKPVDVSKSTETVALTNHFDANNS